MKSELEASYHALLWDLEEEIAMSDGEKLEGLLAKYDAILEKLEELYE